MIREERGIIIFDGEDGERFNTLAKKPNKETVKKRDAFFKEIDEFMKDVIIDGDNISFDLDECLFVSEDSILENTFHSECAVPYDIDNSKRRDECDVIFNKLKPYNILEQTIGAVSASIEKEGDGKEYLNYVEVLTDCVDVNTDCEEFLDAA